MKNVGKITFNFETDQFYAIQKDFEFSTRFYFNFSFIMG